MTTVTERKSESRCGWDHRKPLSGGLAIGFESFSRFKRHPTVWTVAGVIKGELIAIQAAGRTDVGSLRLALRS